MAKNGLLKQIIDAALDQGWEVKGGGKSHLKLIPADKTQSIVVASCTPSDPRATKNLLAQCRRSGLTFPQ